MPAVVALFVVVVPDQRGLEDELGVNFDLLFLVHEVGPGFPAPGCRQRGRRLHSRVLDDHRSGH